MLHHANQIEFYLSNYFLYIYDIYKIIKNRYEDTDYGTTSKPNPWIS